MRTFYHVVANTLVASVTNFFVWFAVIFWLYLETLPLTRGQLAITWHRHQLHK